MRYGAYIKAMEALREIGNGAQAVYCYSFDDGTRAENRYPIKIGSAQRCPYKRIKSQQASMQYTPFVDLVLWTDDAKGLEARIHNALKAQQLEAYGREWFLTNVKDILAAYADTARPSNIESAEDLGSAIRTARIHNGMTQTELADAANVRQATVSLVERGSGDVKFTTVIALARALGLKLTV
jgi:DNA-binding XRE family transcriptional regulator